MMYYRRFLFFSLYLALLIIMISGCGGGGAEFQPSGGAAANVASSDCLDCHGNTFSASLNNASITNDGAVIVNTTTAIPNAPTLSEIKGDITDTHYNDWRILANGNFISNTTPQFEGYVLNSATAWAPEGQGYVSRSNPNHCASSCHDYHNEELTVNRKWYNSKHADVLGAAFTYKFTSGVCLRCHSGIGFANYVSASNAKYPDWTAPSGAANLVAHHLTCNACHDAQGYPSSDNHRLRKAGLANLVSGSASTDKNTDVTGVQGANTLALDAVLNAGDSATCITCHQGRESGWSIFKLMNVVGLNAYDDVNGMISNLAFINPHYRAAGATLYSLKGFEYNGLTYTSGNAMHQTMLCVGCHMASSTDEELGGHALAVKTDTGSENVSVCQRCHGPVQSFENAGGLWDADGDGVFGSPKSEINGIKTLIIGNLGSAGIFFDEHLHPYFWNSPTCRTNGSGGTPDCRTKTWNEAQFEAAFNLKLIDAEPGAFAHNFKYSAQLLRDSYAILNGSMGGLSLSEIVGNIEDGAAMPGVRPSGNERPAFRYTP